MNCYNQLIDDPFTREPIQPNDKIVVRQEIKDLYERYNKKLNHN